MGTKDPSSPRASAVLVAAGLSRRMGTEGAAAADRKPMLELAGVPVLEHTAAAFDACDVVHEIIVVAHPDDQERIAACCADRPAFRKVRAVVAGGPTRAESVRLGCRASSNDSEILAIHDAARPLILPEHITAVVTAAADTGAALLALPVSDTLKFSVEGTHADRTVPRRNLWRAQTPQCFLRERFLEILARAEVENGDDLRPTDDSSLWEHYEGPVTLVTGSAFNMKITTPEDLEMARLFLATSRAPGELS